MTTINSSEFNSTVNQLQSVFRQIGTSSMGEYSTYINSVFSIGGSIEQIATGNENQKVAGVQNLIEQAMNLVNKLVNIQADANNKVKANKEKAEKVSEKATQTEQELNSSMQEISQEIEGQTLIVNDATATIQETQEALAAKEEKINQIFTQIQQLQEALKNATTIEQKRQLLDQIGVLGADITSLMADFSTYQETLESATSVVEGAFTAIETAKGNAVQKQQDGQLKIVENVQEATEATTSTASTQAEGVKNISLGTALEGAAAGGTIIPFAGVALASNSAQKGAELISAGTVETTGSISNLNKLLQGIGNISNNTQLLSTFKTAIGGALGNFNTTIGSWNTAVEPLITSIGTIASANIGEQAATLQTAVTTDHQTLDNIEKGETQNDKTKASIINPNGETQNANLTDDPSSLVTPTIKLSFGI